MISERIPLTNEALFDDEYFDAIFAASLTETANGTLPYFKISASAISKR